MSGQVSAVTPRIGSLCSGVAGLDMAVEAFFGASTAWFVENDAHASQVLARHCPDTPNHGDVKGTDWDAVGPVNILTAGYPCQPFSHAGRRKGTEDERHLWPYVADAIGALRPRIVVLENVAGHLTLGGPTVVADLAALGYVGSWTTLRASDVGACHRRNRWFCVATDADHLGREGTVPESWRDHGRGGRAAAHANRQRLTGGTEPHGEAEQPRQQPPCRDDTHGLGGVEGRLALLPTPRSSDSNGSGVHGDGGLDLRTTVVERLLPTPSAADGLGGHLSRGGDRSDELLLAGQAKQAWRTQQWGEYAPAIARHERVIGRSAPAPTDDKGRLSPEFVEWMMMLPLGWTEEASRAQRLKMLGNGVVPHQAYAALQAVAGIRAEVAA